jgi:metal-responsive CopG/Arc/MetJ family transcriptional regulator
MKTARFEMKVPEDLLARVDDWRRHDPDLPNRSEAMRRLIEAGLTAKPGTDDSDASGRSEPRSARKSAASPKKGPTAKSG